MKLKGVDHLAFVVSDLERSVKCRTIRRGRQSGPV